MNIETIIAKYGIEDPSTLAATGCTSEEYLACLSRNSNRIAKMTDEEYQIYRQPAAEQLADDLHFYEEHRLRHGGS